LAVADPHTLYRAEPADARIVEPLDMITLVYQRRSGITHLVGEPVPQILAVMGEGAVSAAMLVDRLSGEFDLGPRDAAMTLIAERLDELAAIGLVERAARA
jgi:PqqD family protein of HPr-rel-A system